jgi:hypothetical protein
MVWGIVGLLLGISLLATGLLVWAISHIRQIGLGEIE